MQKLAAQIIESLPINLTKASLIYYKGCQIILF